MPEFEGQLHKMQAQLPAQVDEPVQYSLVLGEQLIPLQGVLGAKVRLQFSGAISCIHCGRKTKKSFSQGYCYPCFQTLAQCDRCIMSPELCHFDAGTCREPDWAETHCMTDHIVYLANSSGLKVGITRASQVPTRWIDQGAVTAVPFARVATRKMAGLLESAMKTYLADKTNWRLMLKNAQPDIDLRAQAAVVYEQAAEDIQLLQEEYGLRAVQTLESAEVTHIRYPVAKYPSKLISLNADKTPLIEGVLEGIKGQYWLLDTGVINLRKYTGYQVCFSY